MLSRWGTIYYFSRKTTPTEAKYTSYELEVLAIIQVLKKFRSILSVRRRADKKKWLERAGEKREPRCVCNSRVRRVTSSVRYILLYI